MGLPLPTQTLFEIQQKYWQQGDDFSQVSEAEAMERRDRAYHGNFKRWLRRTDPEEPDHNVTDNRCEPIVSTGVDWLIGDEVKFEVTDDEGAADEEAQTYLDAVWDANNKMPLLAEYEINSGVFGHSFFKLEPDDPDTAPYPRLTILNPMQMTVTPAASDIRKVVRYAFSYPDIDPATKKTRLCRQLTEREKDANGLPTGPWYIRDQVKTGGGFAGGNGLASVFTPVTSDYAPGDPDDGWVLVGQDTWEYPWSPIHDAKNLPEPNSYWGKPDLGLDLIHLNDVINFQLSNINRILYFHAHPKPHYFGAHPREIDVSPSGSVVIPNVNARVEQLEMHGDLTAAYAFLDELCLKMDERSHVPSLALGAISKLPGVPSGVALEMATRPLQAQTLQKRNLRAPTYVRLCQHILELGGFGAARKIQIHWPEMLPIDALQEAQSAQIWHGLGVSEDTLQQRGGFTPEVEREKREEEDEADASQALAQQQALVAAAPPGTMDAPAQPMPNQQQAPQSPPTRTTASPQARTPQTRTNGRTNQKSNRSASNR